MEEEEGKRPWWDRALDPLRHEASMFNVLLGVVLAAAVVIAVVLAVRALT
jgi:hypothetical protein